MQECSIEREARDEMDVVHLQGSLDAYSFPRLESAFAELTELKRHQVILDCAGLEYISSAALGALISFARRAHEQNGDLKLAAVSPKIMSIIELLGFNKILEIVPDVEQAAETFSS
jgi:anti-sigma B factor antagonist